MMICFPQYDLKGKTVLITGAASGIGLEMARQFAKSGANVCVADLDVEQAEIVVKQIVSEGGCALALGMDVSSEVQVDVGVDKVVTEFGRIDILISNAGIQIINPIDKLSFSEWKKMLAIHLDGAFLTTRAVLRYMYADKLGGTIIYYGVGTFTRSLTVKGSVCYGQARFAWFEPCGGKRGSRS